MFLARTLLLLSCCSLALGFLISYWLFFIFSLGLFGFCIIEAILAVQRNGVPVYFDPDQMAEKIKIALEEDWAIEKRYKSILDNKLH